MNKKILIITALVIIGAILTFGIFSTNTSSENNSPTINTTNRDVKEFTMTSYTKVIDGNYAPEFSLNEITVKKGDLVRLKITTTKGSHDFKLDEFDIYENTPLNKEVVIEFVADKSGEFIYYCNKPNHRTNGHWGTLIVTE